MLSYRKYSASRTRKKSCTGLRLVPKWVTLNDLDLDGVLVVIMRFTNNNKFVIAFNANHVKVVKG